MKFSRMLLLTLTLIGAMPMIVDAAPQGPLHEPEVTSEPDENGLTTVTPPSPTQEYLVQVIHYAPAKRAMKVVSTQTVSTQVVLTLPLEIDKFVMCSIAEHIAVQCLIKAPGVILSTIGGGSIAVMPPDSTQEYWVIYTPGVTVGGTKTQAPPPNGQKRVIKKGKK